MGCLHSKKETSDLHPNVYRVVNVDEHGEYLCSGQLEITENDLILYREGRDSTVWPLHSLRRYGFEEGMFSFESGRRCETGEGIYAFKCRRASALFRTLQQQILTKNMNNVRPASRLTPSPQGRQTLQASVVHRSSIDNGQPTTIRPVINNNLPNIISDAVVSRNLTQSPRSPSSVDILEVMPLYPRSQSSTNQVTNVYQFRDFKREHNNNQSEAAVVETHHVYTNDFTRDLAILRNTLREETALSTMRDLEDETLFLESRYMNKNVAKNQTHAANNNPLSPTLSTASEHYAQLSLEQQQQQQALQQSQQQHDATRLYMNIAPNEAAVLEASRNDTIPTTPLTPKQMEYCNLSVSNRMEINTYANLTIGELGDGIKNAKQSLSFPTPSEQSHKYSELDTFASMSPVEEIEVNYAVLDIDSNKETFRASRDSTSSENQLYNKSKNDGTVSTSKPRGRLATQCSLEKSTATNSAIAGPSAAIGYTTIDFDKTVALTSVAAGEEFVPDALAGSRKTRHNSCNIVCGTGSPGNNEKSKLNS